MLNSGLITSIVDVRIFGKQFTADDIFPEDRVIVHEDYPLIGEQDAADFTECYSGKDVIAVSGCKTLEHPYRLMYVNENGYDDYLLDIPQNLRGNRQSYPEVYSFIPGLVYIPKGKKITMLSNGSFSDGVSRGEIEIYIMPYKKLLDKTRLKDGLLISHIQSSQGKSVK